MILFAPLLALEELNSNNPQRLLNLKLQRSDTIINSSQA